MGSPARKLPAVVLAAMLAAVIGGGPTIGQDPFRELEAARRAAAAAPDDPEAAFAVGRLLARLGAVDEALEALEHARRLAPAEAPAYVIAALLLRDAGRLEEAIDLLETGLTRGARAPELHEELGLLLLAAGEPARALEVTAAAAGASPERPRLQLVTGLALAALPERRAEAVGWLERALAGGAPDPGRIHLELGGVLLEEGLAEQARAHLEEAARSLPGSPEAHYRLAAARRAAGDAAGTRDALERFRELSEERDAAERRAKEVGTELNEVQALAQHDLLPEALERLGPFLEAHPRHAPAHLLRAKVLFSMGRAEEALASVVRASSLAPETVEGHYLEGLFLARLGRWAEAAEALERALTLDPDLAEAESLLAQARAQARAGGR